jgi:hypothetical protein
MPTISGYPISAAMLRSRHLRIAMLKPGCTTTTFGTIADLHRTDWMMVAVAFDQRGNASAGDGGTGPKTIRYVHTDNLAGSSVVTDAQGQVSEA